MSDESYLEKDIKDPHDHDVLSGRGNFVNYHPGNEFFRELVRKHKLAYVQCPKPQKGKFSKLIYDEVRARNPPGRYLKQDTKTKLWYDIGERKALDKTRQALREGAPEIMKELSGDEMDPTDTPSPRPPFSASVSLGGSSHHATGLGGSSHHGRPMPTPPPPSLATGVGAPPFANLPQGFPQQQFMTSNVSQQNSNISPQQRQQQMVGNMAMSQQQQIQMMQQQRQEKSMNADTSALLRQTSPNLSSINNMCGTRPDPLLGNSSHSHQPPSNNILSQQQEHRVQEIMMVQQQIEFQKRQIQAQQQAMMMAMMQRNQQQQQPRPQASGSSQTPNPQSRQGNKYEAMMQNYQMNMAADGLNVGRSYPDSNVPDEVSVGDSSPYAQPQHQNATSSYQISSYSQPLQQQVHPGVQHSSAEHGLSSEQLDLPAPLPTMPRRRSRDRLDLEHDNSERSIDFDNVFPAGSSDAMPPPPSPVKQNVSSVGQLSNMSLSIGDISDIMDGMGDYKSLMGSSMAMRSSGTPATARRKTALSRSLDPSGPTAENPGDFSALLNNMSVMSISQRGDDADDLDNIDVSESGTLMGYDMSISNVFGDDNDNRL